MITPVGKTRQEQGPELEAPEATMTPGAPAPPTFCPDPIFTSLACLLSFAAMAEVLSRYKFLPPGDAIIIYDRPSLNDLVKVYPETILHGENGGYYLKNMEGEVFAITVDDLCRELDVTIAEADAWLGSLHLQYCQYNVFTGWSSSIIDHFQE